MRLCSICSVQWGARNRSSQGQQRIPPVHPPALRQTLTSRRTLLCGVRKRWQRRMHEWQARQTTCGSRGTSFNMYGMLVQTHSSNRCWQNAKLVQQRLNMPCKQTKYEQTQRSDKRTRSRRLVHWRRRRRRVAAAVDAAAPSDTAADGCRRRRHRAPPPHLPRAVASGRRCHAGCCRCSSCGQQRSASRSTLSVCLRLGGCDLLQTPGLTVLLFSCCCIACPFFAVQLVLGSLLRNHAGRRPSPKSSPFRSILHGRRVGKLVPFHVLQDLHLRSRCLRQRHNMLGDGGRRSEHCRWILRPFWTHCWSSRSPGKARRAPLLHFRHDPAPEAGHRQQHRVPRERPWRPRQQQQGRRPHLPQMDAPVPVPGQVGPRRDSAGGGARSRRMTNEQNSPHDPGTSAWNSGALIPFISAIVICWRSSSVIPVCGLLFTNL